MFIPNKMEYLIFTHLYTVIFFQMIVMYHIFNTVLTANSCGSVKIYNIPDNITAIKITACSGTQKIHNRIINQELSWSQALASCQAMEFAAVDSALPNWVSRTDVRNYLEGINYKNLNYTFWFGVFRPHLHVRKWYSFRGACKEYPYENPSGDPNDGQCAVIQRNESDNYRESILVEDCNKRYPYVCNTYLGCNDFLAYVGFDVTASPVGANRIDLLNVSLDVCKTECYDHSFYNSFSYANVSRVCTLFKTRSGSLNYTISISNSSIVTHYAKTGCIIEFMSSVTNVSVSTNSPDLPDCEIDEVPSSYCPCQGDAQDKNVTSTDDIVAEIVRNLTIDKKSTASYQRRLKSSSDDRKASKAFGILGIVVIIGTLSLLVLADIHSFRQIRNENKSKRRSAKTKRNRHKTDQSDNIAKSIGD